MSTTPPSPNPNILTTSVADLQPQLTSGTISSVDLVTAYLAQIDRHDEKGMKLRALISVVPRHLALQRAKELDEERWVKGSRGVFHGIPVVVKDTFWTDASMGMDTTCGSGALKGAMEPRNADVVDLLVDAGMIVLGKANLSELARMKALPPNTAGWSAAGGQALSPYVRGGILPNATFLGHSTPGGSSSGSATSVAAGFAPISLGHETDGSIVQPACRAGFFGLKPSVGSVSMLGVQPVCASFDSVGGIAQTAQDLAHTTALLTRNEELSRELDGSWMGVGVGFVDFDAWLPPDYVVEPVDEYWEQTRKSIDIAAERIEEAGGHVCRDVPLVTMQELKAMEQEGGVDTDTVFSHNFKASIDAFLSGYLETPVPTLQEMVDYNRTHVDVCLPPDHLSQAVLESALTAYPDPTFKQKLAITRTFAQASSEKLLVDQNLDVIMGLGDGRLSSIASLAGYAVGSLPLGFTDFNGRAFGVHAIAGRNGEKKLLEVMSAWEGSFPEGRRAPPMMDMITESGIKKESRN